VDNFGSLAILVNNTGNGVSIKVVEIVRNNLEVSLKKGDGGLAPGRARQIIFDLNRC